MVTRENLGGKQPPPRARLTQRGTCRHADNPMAMVLMCLPMLGMVAMIATSVGPRDPTKKE